MTTIRLVHYRNYADTTFDLANHTIFLGPNGIGKTNVVESLRTLSVTKSYRSQHDRDAIQWDESYCRLVFTDPEHSLEYVFTTEGGAARKVMKYDGVATSLTDAYGIIPTVLFSPETMDLITGAPQERRRFLDTLLSQADHRYLESLMTYRRVLRERHFVLLRLQQGLGAMDELDFWDHELVKAGEIIINGRATFIEALNHHLVTLYPQFVDETKTQTFSILYKPTTPAVQLKDKIASSRAFDCKTGTTRYGPHRDELVFLLDNRDITLFASRGEMRSCVLALKLAEAHYLHDQSEKQPILLLDDVFSELDASRRERFVHAIAPFSSVITTTDESFIATHHLDDYLIHRLPLETPPPKKPKKKHS